MVKDKQYAVFVDYCDAAQEVYDSLEEAEKEYNELKNNVGTLNVFLCEVIKRTNRSN